MRLLESRGLRIAIGLVAIAVMLAPAALSFLAGISTNLIWALAVIIIAGTLAWFGPRLRIVFVVAAALALALPPMPMWLVVRDDAFQIRWSQAAFERNWQLITILFVLNVLLALLAARMLVPPRSPLRT
jgi:hypothetical protein